MSDEQVWSPEAGEDVSLDKVARVLRTEGTVEKAAKKLNMETGLLRRRIRSAPFLQAVLKEKKQVRLDKSEAIIDVGLDNGDLGTAKWFLEQQGGERGYGGKSGGSGRLSDDDIERIINALGDDVEKLRAFRDSLAVSRTEKLQAPG